MEKMRADGGESPVNASEGRGERLTLEREGGEEMNTRMSYSALSLTFCKVGPSDQVHVGAQGSWHRWMERGRWMITAVQLDKLTAS